MSTLAASGPYNSLSYEEENFGPEKIRSYKFDFLRGDGTKMLTRWFDKESGQEVRVATYGSDEKVNSFKFHLRNADEIKEIEENKVGATLTYQSINRDSLIGKDGRILGLHDLQDIQIFSVQLLRSIARGRRK